MTERMTFTTVNGYKASAADQVDTIRKLLEGFGSIAYMSGTRGIEMKLGAEINMRLAILHNLFARMTVADQIDEEELEGKGARIDRLDKQGREVLREELAFIAGTVNDPYLYASEPVNYQQAAVINLHKARDILAYRVERNTRDPA
jgi:hypothetical protein